MMSGEEIQKALEDGTMSLPKIYPAYRKLVSSFAKENGMTFKQAMKSIAEGRTEDDTHTNDLNHREHQLNQDPPETSEDQPPDDAREITKDNRGNGHQSWADNMSSKVGLPDSSILDYLLDGDEAARARAAVLERDAEKFRTLAATAQSRIEDPTFNQQFIADLEVFGINYLYTEEGYLMIEVPPYGYVSAPNALRYYLTKADGD